MPYNNVSPVHTHFSKLWAQCISFFGVNPFKGCIFDGFNFVQVGQFSSKAQCALRLGASTIKLFTIVLEYVL
jgi:hypothetical protein